MTATTKCGDVGQGWFECHRVNRMHGLGAVASFAGDMGVLAGGTGFGFVIVAHDARALAGEYKRFLAI